MPPSDDDLLDEELDRLLDLEFEQRAARLGELGRTKPDLAKRLQKILAAEDVELFESDLAALADELLEEHAGLEPGTRLGPWCVVSLLGNGGMGRVYLAERSDGAFRKQVAVKVLRRELSLPAEVLRHERELLARLEHPALTRLLDGGISDSGEVYLVMERVEGQSLADWCTEQEPAIDARCDMLLAIADGVAHAHRQRVIHGDIKPENVLVDGEGRPRLLDFGIAQIADATQSTHPVLTGALTPYWAAPERRRGEPGSVRTDLYGLGRLLQFLLLDSPQKQGEIPRRGDLEAIAARATASDPERRYDDVAALASDLKRWRAGHPVRARGYSRGYALKRFLGRHWLAAGAASLLLLLVLAGSSALLWQNRVVRAERDRAQLEVQRSQTVLDYLISILGDANNSPGQEPVTVRRLLADSLSRIERDFRGDESTRQLLLARLADLNVRLGNFTAADTLLEKFRDNEEGQSAIPVQARVLDNRALVKFHQGKLEEATQLTDQALGLLGNLASDTRGLRSQIEVTRAQIQRRGGNAAEAVDTLRRALSLRLAVSPADSAQTVVVRNSLAVALMRQARYPDALAEFEQLAKALASSQREHSKDAANIYNNYASTAFAWGQYQRADGLFAKAMALQQEVFGPSASLAALLNNYGKLKIARGDIDAGAELIQRANEMMVRFAGADSIDAQLIRIGSGDVARARGDFAAAESIYASIRTALAAKLGAQHPLLTRIRALELAARAQGGKVPVSDPAFDQLLQALGTSRATQRPRADLLCLRAELALAQNAIDQAVQSATACAELRAQSQAPDSPTLALAEYLKSAAMWRQQPEPSARQQRDKRWQRLVDALGRNHSHIQRLAGLRTN